MLPSGMQPQPARSPGPSGTQRSPTAQVPLHTGDVSPHAEVGAKHVHALRPSTIADPQTQSSAHAPSHVGNSASPQGGGGGPPRVVVVEDDAVVAATVLVVVSVLGNGHGTCRG